MSEFIDFQNLVRPKSPNTCLIAPPGFAASTETDEDAPIFNRQRMAVFDQIVGIAMERKDWTLVVADEATARLHLVVTSRWMRFKDDIDIAILPVQGAPAQSTIAIYSRSRIGWSDMGVNETRVKALLSLLKEH